MSTVNDYAGNFTIDPAHSEIGFTARHAMVTKVRGSFNEFSGTATSGENLADAAISVTIAASSLDTRNADRDGHVKSEDFLNVEKFRRSPSPPPASPPPATTLLRSPVTSPSRT